MKKDEALKLALEVIEAWDRGANASDYWRDRFDAITAIRKALTEQPVQTLPFGVGGGLVAIKTLLNRDPCAHAKVAIEMIDSMLAEQPAPPPECQTEAEKTAFAFGWWKALEQKRKADSALDRMAENARELGLDYEPIVEKVEDSVGMGHKAWDMVDPKELAKGFHEALAEPPCKTGSQCTSKCPQCDEPAQHQPNIESYLEKDNLQPAQQQEPEYKGWYCAHCQRGVDGSEVTYREQHQCSRSHPHENMDAMCELRTEIARLTNENARLKARHQDDEINTYRMTLLCIRDGLQKGMSKSIQKLQAREINDVLGLPSFASYRTSPQPRGEATLSKPTGVKPWVPLTEFDIDQIPYSCSHADSRLIAFAIEAKLKEKNT